MTKRKHAIQHLIALLLLCSSMIPLTAQQEIDSESVWKEKLEQLDQSMITSGVLYNRVTPAAGLQDFNTQKDRNIARLIYFRQAISELHRASNEQQFISNDELLDRIQVHDRKVNEVPLGLIYADFQMLNYDENKPENGGVIWDGETFELLEGRPLYLDQRVLIISPLIKAVEGEEILFSLPSEFVFNNTDHTIEQLSVDFGEGRNRQLIRNGKPSDVPIGFTYATSGEKVIQFEAKLSNGSIIKTAGKLYVRSLSAAAQRNVTCSQGGMIENGTITADIPFKGYDEPFPIYGKIDYRIYFRTTMGGSSSNLQKPIIIIDGFDPGDKRRILDCDCEQDPTCAAEYTMGGQFQANGYRGHRSMEDLMKYPNSSGGENNLITDLRALGYDVVIVNHPTYMGQQTNGQMIEVDGGADFIERNALTLTRLIKDLNIRISGNVSREQLVIVGPSMGGQISRYALAYMEDLHSRSRSQEWEHNVRLWISVDSPHLGANIPMGIQSLIDQAARKGVETARDFRDKELRSAAAKQQLIEQHYVPGHVGWNPTTDYMDGKTATMGFGSDHGAPFFKQYYNNLFNNGLPGSQGYPQNLRKISLVNGSLTGSKSYFNPFSGTNDLYAGNGAKVINIRGFQRVCSPWPICYDVHIASLESYFLGGTGVNRKISRFKKLFSDNSAYVTNTNSRGCLDNAPGGWFDAQMQLTASTLDNYPTNAPNSFWFSIGSAAENFFEFLSILLGGSDWDVRDLEPVHSFIPSFSAIGHTSPNRSWAQSLASNLVCQGNTPFDSYYGESQNTQHTSFNQTSVAWMMQELANNPQEPYFPVSASSLSGPSTICQGSTRTFSFAACKTPGAVSQWLTSSNLNITSSTASSVTVNAAADSRASGWVRAVFSNGLEVQKSVWVGKPKAPSGSISGPTEVLSGALVQYNGGTAQGATSYEWWLPHPFEVVSSYDYFGDNWQILSSSTGRSIPAFTGTAGNNGLVQQMGRNTCGRGGAKLLNVEHDNTGGGGGGGIPFTPNPNQGDAIFDSAVESAADQIPDVKIFPNPAQSEATFSIEQNLNDLDLEGALIQRVELFDVLMKPRLRGDYGKGVQQFHLNLSRLSPGIYKVIIHTNKGILIRQLVIERN